MHPSQYQRPEPGQALLQELARARTPPFEALCRIAALHNALSGDAEFQLPRTQAGVKAGDKVFPHPQHLPLLLAAALSKVNALFGSCEDPSDDLHVAVFAIFCILEIHPFDNGNGRTALDFAQLLLMQRWHSSVAVSWPKNAHHSVGEVLRPLGLDCDGQSAAALDNLFHHLMKTIVDADIAALKSVAPIHRLALSLEASLPRG